ncbi:MAG: hypothetical protein QM499_04690 [Flavobacteriaceae bacterium]
MKKSVHTQSKTILFFAILITFSLFILSCDNKGSKEKVTSNQEEVEKQNDILWSITAIQTDGEKLAIKAIDSEGKMFDVNAIQNSDQDSFLNINAFINDKKLPVKILVSDDKFAPVKAIDRGGISYDIKAITTEGEKLDVKGILRFGNIISLKAINKEGVFYDVKATSPSGNINDVKGIKINHKEKEMALNGFNVFAHVKAMHESNNEFETLAFSKLNKKVNKKVKSKKKSKKKTKTKNDFKNIIWNINAITPDGNNLEVIVIDEEGNQFEIKAIQDSEQYCFLNIKAIVNNNELPVKVLISDEEYSPIKAISRDGILYDIKAITSDGTILDVKGISRSGNIIDIKAITANGDFYTIKAISPKGNENDVKGIKIFDRPTELTMRGNKVYAHIKAITQ